MAIELKKAILASFSILFLSFMLLAFNIQPVKSEPRTWTVNDDGSADFPTIQEAINHANSGDTIFVSNGTYYEHVVVNKTVSLIGEDADSTIVDGEGTGSVITVIANQVNLNGFTIRKSGYNPDDSGITIKWSSHNNVSGNKITGNNDGINLYVSNYNLFSNNIICSNNYNGIKSYYADGNIFSDNTIYSSTNGINLYLSSSNIISNNAIFSHTYYGIFLSRSTNNTIYQNNFNNIKQAWSGYLKNSWDYNGEGNYWSDYEGQDLNEDGIGDTSYAIDMINKDNYPLMGMVYDFHVALKKETYKVIVISNSTIINFRFELGTETGNRIIRFDATGTENTPGFSRVNLQTEFMPPPFIVMVGEEETIQTLHNLSRQTATSIYLTYVHNNSTITIISSKPLYLYNELLGKNAKLQTDLNDVNATYHDLLNNYSALLGNYSRLQESYQELNDSYQEHLMYEAENVRNIRNLAYVLAGTTAVFIVITIYLSRTLFGSTSSVRQHNSS